MNTQMRCLKTDLRNKDKYGAWQGRVYNGFKPGELN